MKTKFMYVVFCVTSLFGLVFRYKTYLHICSDIYFNPTHYMHQIYLDLDKLVCLLPNSLTNFNKFLYVQTIYDSNFCFLIVITNN